MKKFLPIFILVVFVATIVLNNAVFGERYLQTYGSYSDCSYPPLQTVDKPGDLSFWRTLVHWDNGAQQIPLSFNYYTGGRLTWDQTYAAGMAAASSWQGVTTTYIKFTDQGQTTVGRNASDGINNIIWVFDRYSYSYTHCLTQSAYAVGFLTTNANSEVIDYDILVNGVDFQWYIHQYNDIDRDDPLKPDVQAILTHELGHMLGIGHTNNNSTPRPVMWLIYTGWNERILKTDDMNAVSYLYPKTINVPGDFSSVVDAINCAAAGSGQTINIVSGTYHITTNVELKSGTTLLVNSGVNLYVDANKTFTIDESSTMLFGSNTNLTVNGILNATGATFTSLETTPGYWYGIKLRSGPNTLYHCNISYATYGITINNSNGTTLTGCNIEYCSSYGLYIWGAGSTNSLIINSGSFKNNTVGLGSTNSWIKAVYSEGSQTKKGSITTSDIPHFIYFNYNTQYGIYINGATLYMQKCQMLGNTIYGIWGNGSGTFAHFTPVDQTSPGYNEVINNNPSNGPNGGQIEVQSSAGAFLGTYPNIGGQNSVYGNRYWIWNNSYHINAQLSIWGSPQVCNPSSSNFVGDVDYTHPFGCYSQGIATLVPVGGIGNQTEAAMLNNSMPVDSSRILNYINDLFSAMNGPIDGALNAIPLLYTYLRPGEEFSYLLPTSWDEFLAGVENQTNSQRLKSQAITYRIKSKSDMHNFHGVLNLADLVLNRSPDDDLWMYCQSQKIYAYIGLENMSAAENVYTAIWRRGVQINPQATAKLRELLNVAWNDQFAASSTQRYGGFNLQGYDFIPHAYALYQNYPNPFNPKTTIFFDIPEPSNVRLTIYDILGRVVAILVDRVLEAGYQAVSWDVDRVSSGAYLYRIDASSVSNPSKSFTQVKKMLALK